MIQLKRGKWVSISSPEMGDISPIPPPHVALNVTCIHVLLHQHVSHNYTTISAQKQTHAKIWDLNFMPHWSRYRGVGASVKLPLQSWICPRPGSFCKRHAVEQGTLGFRWAWPCHFMFKWTFWIINAHCPNKRNSRLRSQTITMKPTISSS